VTGSNRRPPACKDRNERECPGLIGIVALVSAA
jgi:hypothetical protein